MMHGWLPTCWHHRVPPLDTALIDGDIGFRQDNGGHTDADVLTFPTFAEKYINVKH
jgi:hypothetical protein